MKPILEDLYLGRLYPLEQIVPQNPEYHSVNQKKSDLMEILETKLSAEDYQTLEEILELDCDASVMEAFASFECGVKLGVLLMLEVMDIK
ncbi:MAG TPA: hypothetical protein DDW50_21255 [Firmicutes bacterium]|jgi:hypothetical protein|nr:hypothetical protein [Bacillota bacterium]